ncbi:MAG: pantoate--beta-alanine ligase [Thermodesulfatator sp.]|nr:MAG: pantoate--beta-alanine ligase [Thermodesulfatator sp.]
MKTVTTKEGVRHLVGEWKKASLTVGFVPTMGYFHQGHLSLMDECRKLADRVIVSLFVNPSQFGPNEDLASYPRDIERDLRLAGEHGVDAIFMPDEGEMYPRNHRTWVIVEDLTERLCGGSRPGHFRGVATVVAKLFNIVQPDVALFGQKDFQQLQVIRQMAKDLDMPVKIVGCPIVREKDGLAMSSRNAYLSEEERRSALCLYRALTLARRLVLEKGVTSCLDIQKAMREEIESFPFTKIDYIFTGDPESLQPLERVRSPLLVALAVFVGTTRLIDNMLI